MISTDFGLIEILDAEKRHKTIRKGRENFLIKRKLSAEMHGKKRKGEFEDARMV